MACGVDLRARHASRRRGRGGGGGGGSRSGGLGGHLTHRRDAGGSYSRVTAGGSSSPAADRNKDNAGDTAPRWLSGAGAAVRASSAGVAEERGADGDQWEAKLTTGEVFEELARQAAVHCAERGGMFAHVADYGTRYRTRSASCSRCGLRAKVLRSPGER